MKNIILNIALLTLSCSTFAQIGVNTSVPDPSAALDVESTTLGFLPPRMTEAQTVSYTHLTLPTICSV